MTRDEAVAAIVAARAAFAALPERRRAELNARFERAQRQAQWHAEYTRPG